jgi:hypothetical protein
MCRVPAGYGLDTIISVHRSKCVRASHIPVKDLSKAS